MVLFSLCLNEKEFINSLLYNVIDVFILFVLFTVLISFVVPNSTRTKPYVLQALYFLRDVLGRRNNKRYNKMVLVGEGLCVVRHSLC